MPSFRPFTWKDSNFRIRSTAFRVITDEIRAQRALLEARRLGHAKLSLESVACRND